MAGVAVDDVAATRLDIQGAGDGRAELAQRNVAAHREMEVAARGDVRRPALGARRHRRLRRQGELYFVRAQLGLGGIIAVRRQQAADLACRIVAGIRVAVACDIATAGAGRDEIAGRSSAHPDVDGKLLRRCGCVIRANADAGLGLQVGAGRSRLAAADRVGELGIGPLRTLDQRLVARIARSEDEAEGRAARIQQRRIDSGTRQRIAGRLHGAQDRGIDGAVAEAGGVADAEQGCRLRPEQRDARRAQPGVAGAGIQRVLDTPETRIGAVHGVLIADDRRLSRVRRGKPQ